MKAQRSVLVCFPLKEEAAPFRKIAANKPGTAILLTGIGRQNAERSLRVSLAAQSAELVLSCGFAGGLNPDLKLGDVVFELANAPSIQSLSPSGGQSAAAGQGEGLCQDGGVQKLDEQLEPTDVGCHNLKEKLLAVGARPAKFFCADEVATTAADKQKLHRETGADAVEMESAAIHAVCVKHGVPCATVRVISDPADADLPLDFNALARPDKSLDYSKLLLAIAKSPGKIGALMKLQKQTQFAAERLAQVLFRIL
jgi:adenosylhomocysteine nucleosidase